MLEHIRVFIVYTLFDITDTGVTRATADNQYQRNQKRNWETLLQILSLRTQPLNLVGPTKLANQDLSKYQFGEQYSGNATVWRVEFEVDQPEVFTQANNPLGALIQDADLIPLVVGLDETVTISPSCIQTSNTTCNTYFELAFKQSDNI